MRYFDGVSDLKAKYRELVKQLHPDVGGSAEEFIEMKRQYEQALLSETPSKDQYKTPGDLLYEAAVRVFKDRAASKKKSQEEIWEKFRR